MSDLRTSHALTGAALVVSLLASFGLWKIAQHNVEQELRSEFDFHSEEIFTHIKQRMDAYKEVLHGVRGLFDASNMVTREEFRDYVYSLRLDEHYPGIQGLSHARVIPRARLDQHIDEVRAQGFPEYSVSPAGEREIYSPVIYLEPFTGRNKKVLGYDTFSEPVRRSAMLAARDHDRATMSGKVTLIQESDEDVQAGFLVFLPVYRKNLPTNTMAERSSSLYGWVTAVFRMNDLMAGLGHLHSPELAIDIYNADAITDEAHMFSSGIEPAASGIMLSNTRKINIIDRIWTVNIRSTPLFEAQLNNNLPVLTGTTGIVFSLMLTMLAYAYVRAKNIGKDLAESEERLRFALEGAGDGVWDWNLETEVVAYSRRWKEMLGYTEHEIGNRFSECKQRIHPDDAQSVMADLQLHLEGKTSAYTNEHRTLHKDGKWRWMLDRGMVISRTKDGNATRLIGTHTDITERKQAETELKEQRDFNNAVMDAAGNIIVVIDTSENIVYFNRAAEELTGFRSDELFGQPIWDWVIPEEQQPAVKQVFEYLKAGDLEIASRHENDWLTRDGTRCTLEWRNTILRNEEGEVSHIVALGYDLMARKDSEKKIQRLSQLYSTLSHCDQAIVRSTSASELFPQICRDAVRYGGFKMAWIGEVDKANQKVKPVAAYGECTGYLDKVEISIDVDDPAGCGPTGRAIRDNRPVWCQDCAHDYSTTPWHKHCVQYGLKSSAALPLCINGVAIGAFNLYAEEVNAFDGEARELLIQMASDISFALDTYTREKQRKQAEKELSALNANLELIVQQRTNELRHSKELADTANQAKSDFLSNMSHEIRTPLTAIIGFSEALLTNKFDQQEHQKLITTIARNGKHLQQIINDILDLSKIEANQLEHELVETSLLLILGDIQSLIGPGARDKGLEFRISYHFPLPAKIVTGPVYIKQILINLCSNASKFTNEGYVHVDVSCDSSFRHIRFEVADSGIGMTPEEVEHAFDPFTQADTTNTRQFGGTGLGLAISSKLAEAIDGKLSCVSEKDSGSCFTLNIINHATKKIDVINSMEEAHVQDDVQQDQPEIKPLTGKILLVEDSPDNQELITMFVRKTGADIDIAINGQQGVDMALTHEYDLVLMDMQMPVLDGLEAITLLRSYGYAGPIVSLTANALLTNREKCLAAGANGYLVKPIDLVLFYQSLNEYLPAAGETTNIEASAHDADRRKYADYYNSPGYLAIVERFRENLPTMLAELAEAIDQQDWDRVQKSSHDLKGIGTTMGLPKLTDLAGRMNALIRKNEYDQAAQIMAALERLHLDTSTQDKPEPLAH